MADEILLCSIDTFQRCYLPFIPEDDKVDNCVEKLKKNSILSQEDGLQWSKFKKIPSGSPRDNRKRYAPIAHIAQALASFRPWKDDDDTKYTVPRIKYNDCTEDPVISEFADAHIINDGCFHLGDRSNLLTPSAVLATHNIVAIAEYSGKPADAVYNRMKVASTATHIMNDDPRRTFVFGLTIEGTAASLWYFDRSHSTKSEPFDFVKNPRTLISVFLSLLFARETGLGYDPVVRRCNMGQIHHEYRVGSRFYRTLEAQPTYRYLVNDGCMSRACRALEITEFGGTPITQREVTLKDVWLDAGTEAEASIQQKIFQAIDEDLAACNQGKDSCLGQIKTLSETNYEDLKATIEDKTYRNSFANIEQDVKGQMTRPIPEEAVPTRGLFHKEKTPRSRGHLLSGADPARGYDIPYRPKPPRDDATPAPVMPASPSTRPGTQSAPRTYKQKVRRVIIFTEVGEALHDIKSLQTTFRALKHVLIAQLYLFIAKWVHRDISTRNILVMEDENNICGKLINLEYASPRGLHSASSIPETGTPFFMAHELLSGKPLKHVTTPRAADRTDFTDLDIYALDPGNHSPTPTPTVTASNTECSQPLKHDYDHDAESIWWVAPWTLTARIQHAPGQQYATKTFINKMQPSDTRSILFAFPRPFAWGLRDVLHDKLLGFTRPMVGCLTALSDAYSQKEEKPIYYLNVYSIIVGFLDTCIQLSAEEGLPDLVSLRPWEPVDPMKSSMETAYEQGSPEPDFQDPPCPKKPHRC